MAFNKSFPKREYLKRSPGNKYQLYLLEPVQQIINDKTGSHIYYKKWDKAEKKVYKSKEKLDGYFWECQISVIHDGKLKVLTLNYRAFKEFVELASSSFDFVRNYFLVNTVQEGQYWSDHVSVGPQVDAETLQSFSKLKPIPFFPPKQQQSNFKVNNNPDPVTDDLPF